MVRVAIVLMMLLLPPAAWAQAEKRIALVITNQAYTQAGARLTNTHRDGDLVKAALEKVGFTVWTVRDTANEAALVQVVSEHVARLATAGPDAIGFFYYSGHGAADRPNGENYLIPTAAPLTHVAQLPLLAVRLDRITSTLSSAGKMSFVVFDACRNVPLQRETKDLVFKGFAPVREQNGLLVAFATEPGNVAVDQSLYAKALAEEIIKPGLEAAQVFRRVRLRVREDTKRMQSPEYLDKREYDFHFAVAMPPTGPAAPPPPKAPEIALQPETKPGGPSAPKGFRLRQHTKWKMQTAFPKVLPVYVDAVEDIASALKSLSGGTLEIDIKAAGQLMPPFEILDATHKGILDAAWAIPAYWSGKHKSYFFFGGRLPFGLGPSALVRWMEAEGIQLMDNVYSRVLKLNVRSLPCGIVGPNTDWFKQPVVDGPALLKRSFRVTGPPATIASRAGINVHNLPAGEILPAVERGALDGAAWTTPLHGVQLGLHNAMKVIYYPGWSEPATLLELLINRDKWSALEQAAQDGVVAACRKNLHLYLDKIREVAQRGLDEARTRGVQVLTYPPGALDALKTATASELSEAAQNDPEFSKVMASYNKFR